MAKTIYVHQYSCWWKLTPQQWRTCCEAGATGEGYMLPDSCQLSRRPPLVGVVNYNDGMSQPSYYPLRDDVKVFEPLDWEPEAFVGALKELDEWLADRPKSSPQPGM